MNIRIGKISQIISPSHSHCGKCGTTWNFVKMHIFMYTPTDGMFPLCEKCWNESSIEERKTYCMDLLRKWKKYPENVTSLINKAIENESVTMK